MARVYVPCSKGSMKLAKFLVYIIVGFLSANASVSGWLFPQLGCVSFGTARSSAGGVEYGNRNQFFSKPIFMAVIHPRERWYLDKTSKSKGNGWTPSPPFPTPLRNRDSVAVLCHDSNRLPPVTFRSGNARRKILAGVLFLFLFFLPRPWDLTNILVAFLTGGLGMIACLSCLYRCRNGLETPLGRAL
ncbi:hypothetical protein LX32DRAFT_114639 [Colletotrichum zoysiae]|uniref:Transmembrane protein n=1 Tax=Colletotrichum zoysiae TaxID=1216348 RepID=A0AAD9H7X3_9PEZI|nr:hypothetical protein LX32DRAFT_114639 [Colletotrichum zoysiae]